MAQGEFAHVRKYLEIALGKTAPWPGEHDLYAMLVDAAAQQRDPAGLQLYAARAEQLALRYDHKLYQAIAHRAWGVTHHLAGRHQEAEVRLKQALELFEALDTRWQVGRTLFELGDLALSQSEKEAAGAYYSRALATFEKLGALPFATRAREKIESI